VKKAEAFSPAHITGFFQIFDRSSDPLRVGSKGAGVSVSSGVTTSVLVKKSSENSSKITINGRATKSAVVSRQVVKHFLSMAGGSHRIIVAHRVDVPIGQGFGASGAGALSLALALNEAFNLNLTRLEAAQIAHIAEVKCNTGLGTVIGETFGGLEIRLKPGAPGVGKIRKIPVSQDYVVACLHSGPMSTKSIITNVNYRRNINNIGSGLGAELAAHPTPANFMTISRKFAEHLGLISSRLRTLLDETDKAGLRFSMAMLGESIFTIIRRNRVAQVTQIFDNTLPGNTLIMNIDQKGARVL
jgi:pantoate kinase